MPRLSKIGAAALAAFGWTLGSSGVTASFLVVAGGGSGGKNNPSGGSAAGGGAGEVIYGTTLALNATLSYVVTVGAGGPTTTTNNTSGTNGNNSSFASTVIAIGGGGGGAYNSTFNGRSGGSGGGGCYYTPGTGGASTTGTLGGGTHYGNAGGTGASGDNGSGGGGGASAAGGNGSGNTAGVGGNGQAFSITGSSVTYGGGGGGGNYASTGGAGGSGGGGAGSVNAANATPGTANLGGGGGGGGDAGGASGYGGQGGSGVVIISYAGAQQFSGGIVTSVGGNTIHTFTTSGTLGPITTLSASYLIVAGGSGGGRGQGGGGGAGGLLSGSGLTIDPNSTYLVTVGAGGAGSTTTGTAGVNGGSSTFSIVATTAVGGGGGGSPNYPTPGAGSNGGSGGGGSPGSTPGTGTNAGTGTAGQGNNGGQSYTDAVTYGISGGGGGAGAVGSNAVITGPAGNGGIGVASSISGTSTYYAGGGGGGGDNRASNTASGSGGNGGGGAGGNTATAGTANTGGGGGGGAYNSNSTNGANGGSGVVIISYAGATQQMAGGTVTIVGGNVIHTFTSTGYLAPIDFSTGSLRTRASNSGYLTRTPTVASNRRTWTWSGWVKRGSLTSRQIVWGASTSDFNTDTHWEFYSGDQIRFSTYVSAIYFELITNAVFRDPAAWYHVVATMDTTQATASNRAKLYVNGVQVTSFSTETYPSQNYETQINNTIAHSISRDGAFGGYYFDGEVAEVNFVDGQSLTPNSFGTFNSYGVWQPITYGGSYGTNGFYLPFNRQAVSYVGSFSGSNYLTATAPSAIGTSSFTTECYAYINSAPSVLAMFVDTRSTDTNGSVIYIDSSRVLVLGAGSNYSTSSNVTLSLNRWYHLAVVRSGSTVTGYVNGTAVISYTDSTNLSSTQLRIGTNYNAAYSLNGYISNARVVNGTAVYTSNFVPSTSALTAVSGTTILTLQNSSIVDNSGNSLSITNTGGVSTGQTYPFAYGIFNDQSPAGNNWTPSGVSGAFGSTLDYLGDAPTLTSATVANYCTLNPLNYSTGTVSNGNLQWAATAGVGNGCFSTFAFNIASSTELYYWEFTFVSGDTVLGIAPTTLAPSSTARAGSYSYYTNGNKYSGVSASSYGSSYAAGDVIGVAVGNGSITFYKNGVSQGVAFSSLTGTFTPAIWEVICTVSVNFGQQPFKYTIPSGYVALNTYNL